VHQTVLAVSLILSNTDPFPVFFICFRESLETSIIVSVLLAFLKQTLGPEQDAVVHKRLVRQVSRRDHLY